MEILDVVRQSRINRQVYTCSDQFNVLFPFFFSHSFHWFSSSQSRTRRVVFFRTDLRSGTMHTLKYRFGSAIQSILVVSKKNLYEVHFSVVKLTAVSAVSIH